MFFSTLRATFIALTSLAIAVSASPALSLKVAGVASVQDIENFKVNTIITNTGDETLKILNDPRGPLSKAPTDTFTITNANGDKPSFTGVSVNYAPNLAIANHAYTVLAPSQSIDVEHNLAEAYDFSTPGAGSYNITAKNMFYVVDASSNISPVEASLDGSAHEISLTGRLVSPRPSSILTKRANFVGCSSARQSQLNAAFPFAQGYAASALTYLTSHHEATPRFTTWFGTYSGAHRRVLKSHFTLIGQGAFSSFTYDCTCTDPNYYAYVYASGYGNIYLCPPAWTLPSNGDNSLAGTLIHEASHWTQNGGTDDYSYGRPATQAVAISNPDNAIMNAAAHKFFVENVNPTLA